MKISLVISTYNWPEALEIVLLSVLKQSTTADEIIIADDGSKIETKNLIKLYNDKHKLNLHHIWHHDIGFRKTKILNRAICKAKGDYIIQIDGDIVLHKHFIKDHKKTAKKGYFIHGSRVFLNKRLTAKTLINNITKFSFFNIEITNRLNAIRITCLSKIISVRNKNLNGTRGCNFSFWKKDFLKVNGYNINMKGWGKEDTELSARLINSGLIKYKLKCKAVCYHLHHKKLSIEGLKINNEILKKVIKNKIAVCNNGINKYEN